MTSKRAFALRILSAGSTTMLFFPLTGIVVALRLGAGEYNGEVTLWTIWPAILLWLVVAPFVERAFHRFLTKRWGSSVQ
jgi:hypothetical protein